MTVSVEVADPPELTVTGDGLTEVVRLVGTTEVESVTVPVKLLRLAIWIDEVPVDPASMVSEVDPDEMVKSTTLTVTSTEWERDPIIPVTVTV